MYSPEFPRALRRCASIWAALAVAALAAGGGLVLAQQRGFGSAPAMVPRPSPATSVKLVPLTPATSAFAPLLSGLIKISVAPNGGPANAGSFAPAISADGQYVAFVSDASNLVTGGTDGQRHIFVYDRRAGVNAVASLTGGGAFANGLSNYPAISGDGRFVAFLSFATNIAPLPPARFASAHIFVRDRRASTTVMADVSTAGVPANHDSFSPTISGDGRYVSFMSYATNLVPGDTNRCSAVYTRDLATGTTTRDDVTSTGGFGICGSLGSDGPSLSGDGRYVAFHSDDLNLVPGSVLTGVFIRDRMTGVTSIASVGSDGAPFNYAIWPSMSADGRFLSFSRVPSGFRYEIYLRDRATGQTLGPGPGAVITHTSAGGRYLTWVGFDNEANVYDRIAGRLTDIASGSSDTSAAARGVVAFSQVTVLSGGSLSSDVYLAPVPQAGAPSAPTGLAWSLFGSTLTITWAPPAGGSTVTGYIIEAGSAPGGTDVANFATGSTATTFSASISGYGVFYIRVRATGPAGVSNPSNEVIATVGSGLTPPGAPTALSAIVAGSTVTLAWNAPLSGGPVASYVIEAGSSPGAANLANFNTNSTAMTYTATGVGAGTYFVRVRGANSGGAGLLSNEVTVVVG